MRRRHNNILAMYCVKRPKTLPRVRLASRLLECTSSFAKEINYHNFQRFSFKSYSFED